jgi:hypothetical protein
MLFERERAACTSRTAKSYRVQNEDSAPTGATRAMSGPRGKEGATCMLLVRLWPGPAGNGMMVMLSKPQDFNFELIPPVSRTTLHPLR